MAPRNHDRATDHTMPDDELLEDLAPDPDEAAGVKGGEEDLEEEELQMFRRMR